MTTLKHRDVTIFMVEDDEVDRMAFERFIRQNDLPYKYIYADSIKQSKEVIDNQHFDVAVVDFNLIDGNGMEVLKLIDGKVPMIFVTGQGDQKVAVEAMKAGVYDYLIKDSNRNYLQLLPVTIDNAITYTKTEARIREVEEEMEKLLWVVSKTDNSVAIADKHGRIEWINEGFERLTGYTAKEVMGSYGDVLLQGKVSGLNPESEYFTRLLKDKKSITYEAKNYNKNGKGFWVLTTMTPILDKEGEVEKIIAIDSDISERKKVEEELIIAKQYAEGLARTKEEFLANMSHEIRTPMNAIIGMAQLMENTELCDVQRKYLDSIQFASNNLLNIINDVLDLSKIESGQVEFEQIPFDVRKTANELMQMFRAKTDDAGLELKATVGEDVPQMLVGDPTKLNQILINLLSNAIKFTKEGSVELTIKLQRRKKDNLAVSFQVSDTGIGIPKDKQQSIFRSFKQADNQTTRKFGGTGLGLTIVKQLATLMDGSVELESAPQKGSTFTITLPFGVADGAEAEKTESSEPTADLSKLKGKTVLVAEDNELNQMVAAEFLKGAQMQVDLANDGREACQMAQQKQYDLILMDIQMPNLDGYGASKQLREEGVEIPIIAMTAHALSGERDRCLAAGMNDYLTKPIKKEGMLNLITQWLA